MREINGCMVKGLGILKFSMAFLLMIIIFCSFLFAQKAAVKQLSTQSAAKNTADGQCRRRLRAVLYPFIPAKTEFFSTVETLFEAQNPNIDLEIVDLSENYYNTKKPKNIVDANADVYEIDSVFLYDFVNGKRIQEIGRAHV